MISQKIQRNRCLLLRRKHDGNRINLRVLDRIQEIAMTRPFLASSIVVAGALWGGAAQAVPQAFVHSEGSDLNVIANCTVIKPCRTFAAALTVTDDGGEVMALDTEDFGPVTIKQSVSIIGNGRASIVVASVSGAGVDIVKSGINVVLRGLNLEGLGRGMTGVNMKAGQSLAIENCVIANFFGTGLSVTTAANVRVVDSVLRRNGNGARIQGGATADVVRSQFMGNAGAGLAVQADTGATTSATVSDSFASGSLSGFEAGADSASGIGRMVVTNSTSTHNRWGFVASASAGNAIMSVGNSTAAHNDIGFAYIPGVAGFSIFETLGNNTVRQNVTNTSGPMTPVSPM
jgi:Right handed beta helix region